MAGPLKTIALLGATGSIGGSALDVVARPKHAHVYDDALDAFGVHGIGGIWGGILTGLFARPNIGGAAGAGADARARASCLGVLCRVFVRLFGVRGGARRAAA